MLYRWSAGSITQLETTHLPESDKIKAVLRLRTDANSPDTTKLRKLLTDNHIINFVETDSNTNSIVIPEISDSDNKKLLTLLSSADLSQGQPQIIESAEDKEYKKTKGGFFKGQALVKAAALYIIGDITWIVSGMQRARHNRDGKFTKSDLSEMLVGVAFSLSDVLLLFYGREEKQSPMLAFSDALSKHLKENGVTLPQAKNVTPESIRKSGFFHAVDSFLHKNIFSVKAATKIIGGPLESLSAMKKGNFNAGKFAGGLFLTAGWLPTFLLDKPNAPPFTFKSDDHDTSDPVGKQIFRWVSADPRKRLAAPFGMANDVSKFLGSLDEARRYHNDVLSARKMTGPDAATELKYAEGKQYDFSWNVLHACTSFIGNYLVGKSEKKRPKKAGDREQFMQDMLTVSANVLMSVPDKVREFSIEQTAEFMSDIKGVYKKKEEISELITNKIAQLHGAGIHSSTEKNLTGSISPKTITPEGIAAQRVETSSNQENNRTRK